MTIMLWVFYDAILLRDFIIIVLEIFTRRTKRIEKELPPERRSSNSVVRSIGSEFVLFIYLSLRIEYDRF